MEDDRTSITAVKLVGRVVLAAKLNGTLCFYKLDVLLSYGVSDSINGPTKHRRGMFYSGTRI